MNIFSNNRDIRKCQTFRTTPTKICFHSNNGITLRNSIFYLFFADSTDNANGLVIRNETNFIFVSSYLHTKFSIPKVKVFLKFKE